jgi:hypothetical protein
MPLLADAALVEDAEVRVALTAIAERTTDRELAAAPRTTLEDA